MINNFILILTCITLTFFLYFKLFEVSKILNIYDLPDKNRKLHSKKTPVIAGLLNLIPIILLSAFYNEYYFLVFLFFFTLIGIIDDKYSISPNSRLIYLSLSVLFFCIFETKILITETTFVSINKTIEYKILSIPITILCILLLTNALNMIDGINGLCATYKISSLIIIFFYLNISEKNGIILETYSDDVLFLKTLITVYISILLIFLFFNMKGDIFLGDSGVYLSSSIFSYLLINIYKISPIFNPEIIFLILFLPGIDMLRVFIKRIYNKKNPFKGDREHLHHFLLKKFNIIQIIFLYLFVQILSVASFYFALNFFIILFICLSIYISLLIKFKKNEKK